MKKTTLITAILLIISMLPSMAQREKYVRTETDTTYTVRERRAEITYKGEEAIKKRQQDLSYKTWGWSSGKYMGVNIMYCGLLQNLGTMQLPSEASAMNLGLKSVGVDINFIDAVLFSYYDFGIVTGMGIESNNYRFTNNISLGYDDQGNTVIDDSFTERGIHLTKSKLTTTYLNIPLLFQYNFGEARNGYAGFVSVGAIVGIRLQSYTKTVSPEFGKQKHFSDFNLNNLHVGFQAMVGYRNVALTAKYYPHSIFRTGAGPNVQQASIGIGFTW